MTIFKINSRKGNNEIWKCVLVNGSECQSNKEIISIKRSAILNNKSFI